MSPVERSRAGADAGARVLVIEDDRDLWPLIDRALHNVARVAGVDFAANAEEAWGLISSPQRYALVMSDFLLADSASGYELRVVCGRRQPQAAFVMMSALPLRLPDLASGRFLAKPFSVRRCERFVSEMLSEAAGAPPCGPARRTEEP